MHVNILPDILHVLHENEQQVLLSFKFQSLIDLCSMLGWNTKSESSSEKTSEKLRRQKMSLSVSLCWPMVAAVAVVGSCPDSFALASI